MKMLGKITDCESLEISHENFYDGVSFSKVKNLQCSGCNFSIKRTHRRFLLENMYRKLAALKGIKRVKVFCLRKKSMMNQRLSKVAAL